MAPAPVVKGRGRSKTLRAAAPRAAGMVWAVRVRARAVAKGACLAKAASRPPMTSRTLLATETTITACPPLAAAPLGVEQAGFRRGRQVGHPPDGRKAAGGREAQAAQAVDQAGAVQGGGEGVDLGLGTQGDAEFAEGGGRAGGGAGGRFRRQAGPGARRRGARPGAGRSGR